MLLGNNNLIDNASIRRVDFIPQAVRYPEYVSRHVMWLTVFRAALSKPIRLFAEAQSELYVALDESCISQDGFNDVYRQAARTRAAIPGFINYLKKYEKGKNP